MSTSNPELRPDPYEGAADTSLDPSDAPGSFPFTDHEHAVVSTIDVSDGDNDD